MKHILIFLLFFSGCMPAIAQQSRPKMDTLWHIHIIAGNYTVTDSVIIPHKKASPRYSDTLDDPLVRWIETFDEKGVASSQTVTVSEADVIVHKPHNGEMKIRSHNNDGKPGQFTHIKPKRAKKK